MKRTTGGAEINGKREGQQHVKLSIDQWGLSALVEESVTFQE